jgi:hypothetical protein
MATSREEWTTAQIIEAYRVSDHLKTCFSELLPTLRRAETGQSISSPRLPASESSRLDRNTGRRERVEVIERGP